MEQPSLQLHRLIARSNELLRRRWAGYLLLAMVAVVYAIAYWSSPLCPGNKPSHPLGWWEWSDQGHYLKMAAALAQLKLGPDVYYYPFGYPLLGAAFWRMMPLHPFFIPNLLLVLATACVWWRLARRLFNPLSAILLATLFVATHGPLLAKTMVIPWNTLPSQCALLAGIWVLLTERNPRGVLWLALLAAGCYLMRPIDAACFAPMLIYAVLRLPDWRSRITSGVVGMLVVFTAVVLVASVNLHVFGQLQTPYEQGTWKQIGFFSYPVSYKVFWVLIDGSPLFHETTPGLFFRYPWLLLALPGAIFWIKREGPVALAALLAVSSNWLLYLNYNDFLPSDIYRFTLIHYLAWSFPFAALLTAAACLHGWGDRATRAGFGLSAVMLVLILGLDLKETPLPPPVTAAGGRWILPPARPLLISFPGTPLEVAAGLRLDDRRLYENKHYILPYVPSDLQLLLAKGAGGTVLSTEPAALVTGQPQLAEYAWTWHPQSERLKKFCR